MNRIRRTAKKKVFVFALLGGATALTSRANAQDSSQPTFLGKGGVKTNSSTTSPGSKPAASQSYVPYAPAQAVPASSKPASQPSTPGAGLTSTVATFPNSRPAAMTGVSSPPRSTARPVASGAAYPARPQIAGATLTASNGGPSPRPVPPVTVSGVSAMDADFNVPLPDEKVLHVQVGHSAFINTKHRLSRVCT